MKRNAPNRLLLTLLAAAACTQAPSARAQVYASLEATITDGRNASGAYTNWIESSQKYLKVKADVPSPATCGKSYFQFAIPSDANTNMGLTLTFTTAASGNGRYHVQVWGLDQAFPGFIDNNLIWTNAQANDTNSTSMMLTNGPQSATRLTDFIGTASSASTKSYPIPAPWGNWVQNHKLVLVLTGVYGDPTNNSNGHRILTNATLVSYTPIIGGTPPAVGPISNLTVFATATSATNSFTVSDPEDGPDPLYPVASSSNESIVPSANVFFEGSGANRTVYVIAGSTPGTAQVTVTVTDSTGNQGQRTFSVTVLPMNYPPTISTPAPTNTMANTSVTVPFTVSDVETPAPSLTVSGTIATYSVGILDSLTLSADASGTNRTVTVTPVAGANGVGVVTLSVADADGNTSTTSFGVMVRATNSVVFNEHFDYPDGKLFVNSGSFWVRRSAAAGSVNLNTLSAQANIRPKSGADDGAAPLAGAPYSVGSDTLLYAICTATWYDAGDGALPTNSTGSFLQFLNASAATSVQATEVGVGTNGAPDGFFRLGLIDSTSLLVPNTNVNLTIPPGIGPEPHKIITRYDVRNGTSTLWVDAASETAPAVTVKDVASPTPISFIGLRQDVGMGYIYLDDLQVVAVKKPSITGIAPPAGGNVALYFDGGAANPSDFEVLGTSDLSASFPVLPATIQVNGAGFKATVSATGKQNFYRIKRKPLTF